MYSATLCSNWIIEHYSTGELLFEGLAEDCANWLERNSWEVVVEDIRSKTFYVI